MRFAVAFILFVLVVVGSWALGSRRSSPVRAGFANDAAPSDATATERRPSEALRVPLDPAGPVAAPSLGPATTGSAAAPLDVLVRDSRGAVVADASIWIRSADRLEPVGRTGAEGSLRLDSHPGAGVYVVASHARLASARQYLWTDVSRVDLVLEDAEAISGFVEYPNGMKASGILVAAVDEHVAESTLSGSGPLAATDPGRLEATSRPDGTFEISRLAPGRKYVLLAAGNGCLSQDVGRQRPVPAGASDERVVVRPTYGTVVALFDSTGAPADHHGLRLRADVELLSPGAWVTRLGALSRAELGLSDNECLILAQVDDFLKAIGPVPAYVDHDRFAPLSTSLELTPIVRGLGHSEIRLEPIAAVMGALEVEFVFPQGSNLVDVAPVAQAALTMKSSEGRVFSHEFSRLTSGVQRIEDVPAGRYKASFVLGGGLLQYPPKGQPALDLEVGPEPSRLAIPLDGVGSLELSLLDDRGLPYDGEATVFVGFGRPSVNAEGIERLPGIPLSFKQPPYLVPLVRSGEYSLRLEYPRLAKSVRTVQVTDGSKILVDL